MTFSAEPVQPKPIPDDESLRGWSRVQFAKDVYEHAVNEARGHKLAAVYAYAFGAMTVILKMEIPTKERLIILELLTDGCRDAVDKLTADAEASALRIMGGGES
jgi:hypothetical protein